jgi:hypothetical protein
MKDTELNDVLKRGAVPERKGDYWEQFPSRVMAEIQQRRRHARAESIADALVPARTDGNSRWTWASAFRTVGGKPTFALGVAVVCLALGLVLGSWRGQHSSGKDAQLAEARKYFHEIEALFPNQLQAIVFDQHGTHLVLAPEANLPVSPPLYLKICGPKGCQRFVTFSGQQIRVNGDVCDVLVDHQGKVLVVGQETLWSDAKAALRSGSYQIEARALEAAL